MRRNTRNASTQLFQIVKKSLTNACLARRVSGGGGGGGGATVLVERVVFPLTAGAHIAFTTTERYAGFCERGILTP